MVYLSLREATSAHDLLMSTIKHMYPESSLGALGTACQSMGVWWLVLWDMLLGQVTCSEGPQTPSSPLKHILAKSFIPA